MKLLLTSGGVRNASLRQALVDLLGKPIEEASALCIPTASYGHPWCTPRNAYQFIAGECAMSELGWKSLGVLELSALPSIGKERWTQWVRETDAFLVDGGDAVFLAYWMRESGLADLLPSLDDKVWIGMSAGSMVMTPRIGDAFVAMRPSLTGDDRTLGLVDFALFPHLDYPGFDENTMAHAEQWAAGIGMPSYAIDDQTAVRVVEGRVDVVSEGQWRYFGP